MKKKVTIILALAYVLTMPFIALSGDFDGSKPLVCAVTETVECQRNGECSRVAPESVNLPAFFKIDFEQKIITGRFPDGREETALIQSLERVEGRLVMHGFQAGLGWTMVIGETTGNMILSASGDHLAFVVFGACIPY